MICVRLKILYRAHKEATLDNLHIAEDPIRLACSLPIHTLIPQARYRGGNLDPGRTELWVLTAGRGFSRAAQRGGGSDC